MHSNSSFEKRKLYDTKMKKQYSNKMQRNEKSENENIKSKTQKLTPITLKETKTEEDEEQERQQNITKLKLFTALNNINDEINVKIDSKDKFKNIPLNLDCFINRPSSRKNKTTINNYINTSSSNDIIENQNNNSEYNNNNKENEIKDNNNNKNLNNIISLSLNNKTENNEKDNKDNLDKNNDINNNTNIKTTPMYNYNNINEINDGNNYVNNENNINNTNYSQNKIFKEIPKPKKIFNTDNKNTNYDLNQKLTLRNIDDEDKSFLKNMERKNAFIISDISSLNGKNINNYNISLTSFDIKKLINYYIYLVLENKKEQIAVMNLKNSLPDLKEKINNIKKNETSNKLENNKNKDKEKEKENINLKDANIENKSYNKLDNLDILSRYQEDLNFFEELFNNFNEEIKKI